MGIDADNPVAKRMRGVKKDADMERTRLRDMANRLLGDETFVEWAGDVMVRRGFFDGREGTPYSQGARGAIVQEFERLMEFADDGDRFLARVFRDNILSKRNY